MSVQPARNAIPAVRSPDPAQEGRRGARPARIAPRYPTIGKSSGPLGPSGRVRAVIDKYQRDQSAIGRQAVEVIRRIWDYSVDPAQFSDTWPEAYLMLRRVIMTHHAASAAGAARFYRTMYHVEGQGLAVVRSVKPIDSKLDHIADSVANGAFFHQLNKQGRSPGDASLIARNTLSGAGARFALSGGRDTIIKAAASDPRAAGWERIMSSEACSYCTQHASRGPFKPGMTDFHPHDYCGCVAVPLFKGNAPRNADLSARWREVTKGKTGVQARAAWEGYTGGNNDGNDTTGGDNGRQKEAGLTGQGDT